MKILNENTLEDRLKTFTLRNKKWKQYKINKKKCISWCDIMCFRSQFIRKYLSR